MSDALVGDEMSPFAFSYTEFETWYESFTNKCLEPARQDFERLINQKLDDELNEFDRHRIRLTSSRVKSPQRTWQKLKKGDYRDKITDVESIQLVIDDLVGMRITCNNLVDITYLQSLLSDLPSEDEDGPAGTFGIEPNSEKLYFSSPKPSGYRAYHINLVTVPPQSDGGIVRIRGELQVRTLLQDGWGELTHEDTYKPGVSLPRLVTTIARRMADLLATVDDLAQDLREELDRLAVKSLGEPESETPPEPQISPPPDHQHLGDSAFPTDQEPQPEQLSEPPRQALLDEIRRVVDNLKRPATLASIAQEILSIFGSGIVPSWGGFGRFKAVLTAAVPDVTIVGIGPGVVLPRGAQPPPGFAQEVDLTADPQVPLIVRRLKAFDKNLPAFAGEQLRDLFGALTIALAPDTWRELDILRTDLGIRELNLLSRYARDMYRQENAAAHVVRPNLDYLLKALLWSGNLRSGLESAGVRVVLSNWIYSRAANFGLTNDRTEDLAAISSWLESADDEETLLGG